VTNLSESPKLVRPELRNGREWIGGLEKGMAVFEAFDDKHPRLTATEVAHRCGLSRAAARRYVFTLMGLGFLTTDGKHYWLTPKIMRLGQAYLESARLPRQVQPFLQRLTAGTGEISYVSVIDDNEIVYVARNGSNRAMNTGFVLGARAPGQVTAAGMLLMALRGKNWQENWLATQPLVTYTSYTITDPASMSQAMDEIRQRDWALSEQQMDLAYRGIAVPLRDAKGEPVAALSVSMGMGNETSEAAISRVLPLLQRLAQELRAIL
jgi:IclR family pca regulon transcriptional regulator